MNFIAYAPNGEGCFLQVGTYTDLKSAIDELPDGGHIEQVIEGGSIKVYPQQ